MSRREKFALKIIIVAGLLGALVPVGMLLNIGTAPAIWAASCFGTVIIAAIYLCIIGED
jgi:hypothetical protein